MRIRRLTLKPYRNLTDSELCLDDGATLIVADNGQGKSNILEAISYLSIGKSIRGSRDQEIIPHGGQFFDIKADWLDDDREHELRVFYGISDGKRGFVDGAALPRVSEVVGLFQSVHFAPEDVALVLRFGPQRRRLLDIVLSQSDVSYLQGLQRFQRVLSQRNHFLRGCRGGAVSDEIDVWDSQLARAGGMIRRARMVALTELAPHVDEYYRRFCDGTEQAGMAYRGTTVTARSSAPSGEDSAQELHSELVEAHQQEIRVGYTCRGPHRDSFGFTLDDVAADSFGSQGQLKSLLLAWKMAELRFLEARSGQIPVLLLDDVFSELDSSRTEAVLESVDELDQVVFTAPKEPGETLPLSFRQIGLTN